MESLIERFRSLRRNIEKRQQESLLARRAVTLVAVSKGHNKEKILPLLVEGQRVFAENRVQEAAAKWPDLLATDPDIRLHLIGSLQTNKVNEALSLFNVIETVDRKALIDAIVKYRETNHMLRATEFLLQVNTGEESQKGGVSPKDANALLEYCHACNLPISGLMCVPPADEIAAPHFALLAKMAREFALATLSMGMSHDYETAIRLGATHLRIGTALFGERGL